eukprot:749068-Hanusia_phi.AAC.3
MASEDETCESVQASTQGEVDLLSLRAALRYICARVSQSSEIRVSETGFQRERRTFSRDHRNAVLRNPLGKIQGESRETGS